MGDVPTTLTVVMVNDHETECAIMHLGEWKPFQKRTVHIRLTDEQRAMLSPRYCGRNCGTDNYETIGDVWLESEVSDG